MHLTIVDTYLLFNAFDYVKMGWRDGYAASAKLEVVVYLEVGDRSPEDKAYYPDDDIKAVMMDGKWFFQHMDGRPY